MTEDNGASQQFEDLIRSYSQKNAKDSSGKIYVSFAPPESDDPEFLDEVQKIGELFSDKRTQEEVKKTQEPNTSHRGNVTILHKWTSKDGKGIIDISYQPQGIDIPFPMGFQRQEGDLGYEFLKNLPDDYEGDIIVSLNEKGRIANISLPEDQNE